MTEYIDREALLGVEKLLDTNVLRASQTASNIYDQILYDIEHFPRVDVVPTAHGRWIKAHWRNSVSCANCSICGFEAYHYDFQGVQKTYNYCPNCGAKMDLERR